MDISQGMLMGIYRERVMNKERVLGLRETLDSTDTI